MAAAANGMALHGGIIPYIDTFLVFSDYLRPALRLAAIMRQRVIYVLTHDTFGLGEDGPPTSRSNSWLACGPSPTYTFFALATRWRRRNAGNLRCGARLGPVLLVLSRQALPAWRTDTTDNRCSRGGYVLAEAEGPRQATIIATGSELQVAMAAREKLAGDNIAAAVVSLPCWELFAHQDEVYRAQVLGRGAAGRN